MESNLLSNAIKFTAKEKRTINTTVEKSDSEAIVSVKDTGRGTDPEILPKLFTKFTTKSSTGTGLGLFISKSIVEAHGGRIWAENNKEGRGATFVFTLPIIHMQKGYDSAFLCPRPTSTQKTILGFAL